MRSSLYFVDSIDVGWGEISQPDCIVDIFKKVVSKGIRFSRIHLISGFDMPLVNQDVLHVFFDARSNEEFIDIRHDNFDYRMNFFYLFNSLSKKYLFFYIQS